MRREAALARGPCGLAALLWSMPLAWGVVRMGSVAKVEDQHTRRLYAAKVFLEGEEDCRHELEVYSCLAGSGHEAFLLSWVHTRVGRCRG